MFHRAARLAGAVIVCAATTLAVESHASTEFEGEQQTTWRLAELLRSSRSPDSLTSEELQRLVGDLGPAAIEPALEILITRRVPATPDATTPQVLSRPQRAILLGGLGRFEGGSVRSAMRSRYREDPSISVRAAGLYTYGAVGRAEDLPTFLKWSAPDSELGFDPRIEQAFQSGLTELVRRVPRTIDELMTACRSMPEELQLPLVLALGAAGDARALPLLAEVMRWHSKLLVPAASQVAKLGPSARPETNHELARYLIGRLDRDDLHTCPTLALALGSLEETECVPQLIELLDAPHTGIRENALISLQRLTGIRLHASARLWSSWIVAEERWYETEAEACFQELASPSDTNVSAAVRTLSRHPLHRHELALRLAPLAEGPKASLRAVACKALGQLRSHYGVEALVLALDDEDEGVRAEAYAALRAVTGLEHAIDAGAWRELPFPES